MGQIIWTKEAENWLHEIYDYIARDNKKMARQVIQGIYNRAQLLKKHPNAGYKHSSAEEGEVRILLYSTDIIVWHI